MNETKETNKISGIIRTSLESIRSVVDANTIIGNPITTPSGITILPVSKITVGLASGGFDYLGKNSSLSKDDKGNNFGGGGGSGLTVEPVAFLVIGEDGHVDLLNVGAGAPPAPKSDVAAIIDGAPALIDKIRSLFPKKSGDGAERDTSPEVTDISDKSE